MRRCWWELLEVYSLLPEERDKSSCEEILVVMISICVEVDILDGYMGMETVE